MYERILLEGVIGSLVTLRSLSMARVGLFSCHSVPVDVALPWMLVSSHPEVLAIT
jgi:hypothetical protein